MSNTWRQCLCGMAAGALAVAPAVCSAVEVPDEVDTAFRHYVQLPEMLLPVLEKVKDRESAEAAAPELQSLLANVYDTRRDMQKISRLSPEVSAELRRRYENNMRTGWGKVFAQISRLLRAGSYNSPAFTKQMNTLCLLFEE